MALNVTQILPNVSEFANIAVAERSILLSTGLATPLAPTFNLNKGVEIDIRGWGPLTGGVVMQEDTLTPISPERFAAVRQRASIQRPVYGIAKTFMEEAAAAKDPAQYLGTKLGEYWAAYYDRAAMAAAMGSAKSSALQAAALVDISGAATTGAIIEIEDLFDLSEGRTGYFVMSRKVWQLVKKEGLADTLINPFNGFTYPAFDGQLVLLDEKAGTVGTGADAGKYNVYFFQSGAIGAKVQNDDTYLTSVPILGRGEAYASQTNFVVAPAAASFTGTPAADGGATIAELATAGNWALGAPDVSYLKHRVLIGKLVSN